MMLTQGSPAATRTVNDAEGTFHNTLVTKEEGSSPLTYELVMVSLSGSLLLLVVVSVAVKVLWRRCGSRYSSKDLNKPAVVLENSTMTNNSTDKISTVDLTGPVYIRYISEQQTVSTEFAISEETISIFGLPYISFAASITPPDSPQEQ